MLNHLISIYQSNMQKEWHGFKNQQIFIFPFYLYIKNQIQKIFEKLPNCFSSEIVRDLAAQIVNFTYNNYFKYVYDYELRLADEYNLLKGENATQKERYFLSYLSNDSDWITYLFEKYPKLDQMLDVFTKRILRYLDEVLSHVTSDSNRIAEVFNLKNSIVDSIRLFDGDLHNGKCVCSITYSNGVKIYHKPRSSDNEEFLINYINHLKNIGLNVRIEIPPEINRKEYSWHMHINHKDVLDENEISDFYYNWGVLLCVFYSLGTQDIIPDNIICVESTPYLIDCESLVTRPYIYNDGTEIAFYLQKSVLKTGILADWMFGNDTNRNRISSPLFRFKDNKHLLRVNGIECPINQETKIDFIRGFSYAFDFFERKSLAIYSFFQEHKPSLLNSRFLIHPTSIYSCVLEEFTTPEYLSGKKNLLHLMNTLVKQEVYGKHYFQIISSIIKQIERGDIPYFFTKSGGSELFYSDTEIVCTDFYKEWQTSENHISERFQSFSKRDKKYQTNMINENLNFFIDVVRHNAPFRLKSKLMTHKCIDKRHLIKSADTIRQLIDKRMICISEEIGFIGRTRNVYDGLFQVCQLNNSIYDGLLGICIFYRELFKYTSQNSIQLVADKIFKQTCVNYRRLSFENKKANNISLSPLTGIAGILYVMELFPGDYYNRDLYDDILLKIESLIPLTSQYDYMSGLSGLICFLYQARHISSHKKVRLLRRAANRLLILGDETENELCWTYLDGAELVSKKRMVLGGYAHGSSSIAVALYLVYKATDDTLYLDAFKKVLHHDRSFFSEEINGWLDARNGNNNQDSGSWCHGSTGIALSRLQLIHMGYFDDMILKEIRFAIAHMQKRLGYNLSICHGTMGNIEVMNAINYYLGNTGIDNDTCGWLTSIIHQINVKGNLLCGDDNSNSLIGMFMGISGIGYQLLRMADWKSVPCIMCLEVGSLLSNFH